MKYGAAAISGAIHELHSGIPIFTETRHKKNKENDHPIQTISENLLYTISIQPCLCNKQLK